MPKKRNPKVGKASRVRHVREKWELSSLAPYAAAFLKAERLERQRKAKQALMPYLRFLKKQFDKTGNPTFVWEAWIKCRVRHLRVPSWVLGYLDGAASKILRLGHHPPQSDAAGQAGIELGFASVGGKSRFRAYSEFQQAQQAYRIYASARKKGLGREASLARVNLSKTTARRRLALFAKLTGIKPADLDKW
jgi:hypothetical protein